MTHPTIVPRDRKRGAHLRTALSLAAGYTPVLPLRAGKVPFGNCPACHNNACGGRPNMKVPGPCLCPRPCHAWAAATHDLTVITSPEWVAAWREAESVAYHPGGAGLTVIDLDNADAITWARRTLPATQTVPTTRGQHWIYQGTMPSANGVRPGVDIKSNKSYARWLGQGFGFTAPLPDAVRALIVKKSAPVRSVSVTAPAGNGPCPHRAPVFLERGIAMAEQRIREATSGVHATVYRMFLTVLATHGRCGCLTQTHMERLFTVAQTKGESARHCADAWSNALTALGM
ncbi:bifunctional DNA primase/polymerase [Streptomyces cyaneofuscatus]|uniref:bifunctional DNA primase/polymerase n=1 Tax=Streptomyces cyaneofuscatus TaxID=66883 RepID=UPI00386F078E|nr:bifunctional DNA primase/polymerase [Streptomyces cyaneofuscatus]